MNKPAMRNALKKLRKVGFDRADRANALMAPQEMLDFLAMTAGVKPVFLLGRGFNDPDWIAGVVQIAKEMQLRIIVGPPWQAAVSDVPQWFRELTHPEDRSVADVVYICKAKGAAEAVANSCDKKSISMEEEAQLLAYPECCVRDHYRRVELRDQAFFMMVERTSGGNHEEMRRIIRDDVGVAAETDQEKAMLEESHGAKPALFTSFHMCDQCRGNPDSPAKRISARFEELAKAIGSDFASEIASSQGGL